MARTKNEIVSKEQINLDNIKEELKDELTNYVDMKIKKGFKEEIESINKKVIKDKNRTIFFKNILIIILLLIIAFLGYLLYRDNYFDRFFSKNEVEEKENNDKNISKEENKEIEKEEIKETTKEELIKKYGYLLDNYNINLSSVYLKDYYNGELTAELLNYLTLNNMDLSKLEIEEDYNVIDNDILKREFNKLFDKDYKNISFDFNGNKIRFIDKINSYITTSILKKENNDIKKEIISIEEIDNKVIIKTIEGVIIDNKLYNISQEEIDNYNQDALINYQDKLNKLIYTFNNGVLINLEKGE